MKPRSIRIHATEQEECITYLEWAKTIKLSICSYGYPFTCNGNEYVVPLHNEVCLYDCIFHFANESKRSDFGRIMMAKIGTKAGVSDYIITVPTSKYSAMFLEMKKKHGYAKPSKAQIAFIARMKEMGYWGVFAYGADDAIDHTQHYLGDLIVKRNVNALSNHAKPQEPQIIV